MRISVLPILLVVMLQPAPAQSAIKFPALSGRVVDQAGMISTGTERELTQMLASHEEATTNQIVVVTLPDLQGYTIEEYGYQLGRHWGIGQQGKNNGVLLIVSKAERKLRIEVGYGLEGSLTDAVSSTIISRVMTPEFKRGRFDEGLLAGSAAIIQAIGGEYEAPPPRKGSGAQNNIFASLIWLFIIFSFIGPLLGRTGFGRMLGLSLLFSALSSGRRGRRGGFGGGGFGGFSGGGGGFGGGGASGGW